MVRCPPFLRRVNKYSRIEDGHGTPSKKWTAYIGPMGAVILLLLPQPSWFSLVNSQYVSSHLRLPHAFATTILTLMSLSSLAICTFRDPGRPKIDDIDSTERTYSTRSFGPEGASEDEELLEEEEEDHNDFNSSRKWCRTCWAPKPDRTHHCSTCGRCVLKMDHHCPWLSQCVGHRTHATFLHMLFCVTALALYISVASCFVLYSFLFTPIAQPIDDATPLHCLFLVVMGSVFSMVIGSFFGFHVYLCFTNQTTLEQLSPYTLLKYLPKPKKARHAPGTDITRNANLPPLPSAQDDSPYYFPSPPPTPPPAGGAALPIGGVRELIFAASPLSQLPGSEPGTPPTGAAPAPRPQENNISPTRVFSTSPVATNMGRSSVSRTTGFHEWDEHTLSLSQRRLVRRVAGEMYLWDLGWRRNVVATLGSGEVVSSHRRYTGGEGSGTSSMRNDVGPGQNRTSRQSRSGSNDPVYGWKWWGEVLLYGGPPRGDGKTFPRNPKARAALENLRRGLEELERRERGDATAEDDGLHPSAAAAMRPRPYAPTRFGGRGEARYAIVEEDEVELDEV